MIEFKRYSHGLLTVHFIKQSKSAPKLQIPITDHRNEEMAALTKISKEITTYDEDYLLVNKNTQVTELYEKFKQGILNLNERINLNFNKFYVSFKNEKSNIVDITVQKNSLKICINAFWGDLNDAKGLFRNVRHIGHLGNGDYEVKVDDDQELEYILSVIKQNLK